MTMYVRVSSASRHCVERQLTCAEHFAVERGDPYPISELNLRRPPSSFHGGLRQPCSRVKFKIEGRLHTVKGDLTGAPVF
jgi:hypothetical protein